MKTTAFTFFLISSASAALIDEPSYLRNSKVGTTEDSPCNSARDKDTCFQTTDDAAGDPCQWCVAGAIPSECMSAAQSALLPAGVFECAAPGSFFEFPSEIFGTQRYSLYNTGTKEVPQPSKSDLCDDSSNSVSGYMDVKGSEYDKSGENKHLFFWMFEKRGDDVDSDTPFVVWLTGGPGCSSTLALLTENGPCSVNKDDSGTTVNPYSWSEAGHVLWLDQPAGVGFSYGQESDTNEKMIAEDAYYFLQAFFQTYPQYQSNPLYIVGESYGGHYAPAIAHRVWKGNQKAAEKTIQLNLAGLGIGNGLTDPVHQYPAYVDMVTNNSHGIKLVDEATADAMRAIVPKCTALIAQCNAGDSMIDTFACQTAFVLCNTGLTSPYQMTGLNPYDISKKCEFRPLCYDFSHVETWLNQESVKQALNVDEGHSHSWSSCNFGINMRFHTDWMKDFSGYVADLLDAGIPVLVYAGDLDFICNYLGNLAWTLALEWDGSTEFNAAEEHEWEGKGLARSAKGLTFLQVYDAGHMVPADQPKNALDMITNFMQGGDF